MIFKEGIARGIELQSIPLQPKPHSDLPVAQLALTNDALGTAT